MSEETNVVDLPHGDWVDQLGRRPEIIPETGWLSRYVSYAQKCTDAPATYHMAVGLAVVSATLGNRCWLRLYGGKVFPATWHVLLGESSQMRKSTAMRVGLNVLSAMEGDDHQPDDRGTYDTPSRRGIVLPATFSKEGIEQVMQGRGDGIMPAWEFGEMLAMLGKDYMAGTKEQLTRWWDGDSTTRATTGKGVMTVRDPALTIIGASTPAWLEDRVNDGDILGGFLARFNFWPAVMEDKGPWMSPLASMGDTGAFHALSTTLSVLRAHREEFTFEPAARSRFEDWLRNHEETLGRSGFPRQLLGFHGRLSTGVLKMAMALEAATEERSMLIRDAAMIAALKVAEWLKDALTRLFTEEMAFSPHAVDQRRVTKLLEAGAMSRSDILRRLRWPQRQLTEVLETLVESGRVNYRQERQEGAGRPTNLYSIVSGN